jgi:hypothetical protein
MSDPKPTPRPRDRKARRKLSPGQVAYLEYKAVRDKAKADRKVKQRQDAYYLQTYYPEIASAKRAKGVKKNAENSAWRRQMFVESFADWPSVLTAKEMKESIRAWLHDPSRSILNPKNGNRRWKWRGCESNFVKTPASVRKKLTELEVFRYNFRERVWFKAGSVEEAETTQRLAEQKAERRRLEREEAERVEAESRRAYFDAYRKEQQEAERKKAEADQTERDRLSRPAEAGWHDFIPEELKPTALQFLRERRCLSDSQSLDDLTVLEAERFTKHGHSMRLTHLESWGASWARRVAEAVLVAD